MDRAVVLRRDDMCSSRYRGFFFPGNIACNADEAAHVTQLEGQVALPVRAPAGFADDLVNRALVEMRDLAVIFDFLRNEPDIFLPVLLRVLHALCHVDFIPVPADTGTERGVHSLDCIEVPCGNHDEPAGYRFCPDHGAAGALALAGDREFPLLERGEEVLLGVGIEGVDLVDEQDTAVRPVDCSGFDPVVGRSLKASALERVVPDIAEECTGMGTRSRR